MSSTWPRGTLPRNPTSRLRSLFLLCGSFSLCPDTGRVICVMLLPLCHPDFNFLELSSPAYPDWLCLLYSTTFYDILFYWKTPWRIFVPIPGHNLVHTGAPKSWTSPLFLHSMSSYRNFVSTESSSVYCHLTSFRNNVGQHSVGINGAANNSSERQTPLLTEAAGPMSRIEVFISTTSA